MRGSTSNVASVCTLWFHRVLHAWGLLSLSPTTTLTYGIFYTVIGHSLLTEWHQILSRTRLTSPQKTIDPAQTNRLHTRCQSLTWDPLRPCKPSELSFIDDPQGCPLAAGYSDIWRCNGFSAPLKALVAEGSLYITVTSQKVLV